MSPWTLQVWLGFALCVIGIAMHRTGPAFSRHRFGAPVALLGLALMLVHTHEPPEPEARLVLSMIDSLWVVPAVFGFALVLMGAPLYWKARPATLLAGWLLVAVAWYVAYPSIEGISLTDFLLALAALPGVALALAVFALGVRTAERMVPSEAETEPLTEREQRYVESVLKRHLGGESDES